jgi:peptide/nickel transport system ATP-binding protein
VLRAAHLSLTLGHGGRQLRVLNDVSLELRAGETLGLVGESGSGKTTLAKLLLGVHAADPGGIVELDGQPLAGRLSRRNARALRALRIVFQHPDASLNRALPVNRLVGRALVRAEGEPTSGENTSRIAGLLDAVRVPMRYLNARARQLSGGLKQRVAIAQAFAGEPRVVICDEPTSALDVSVQAAILNLLARLQRERGVSYLFISHDLDVVRYLADRVMVLYAGHVVESGPARAVLSGPCHPYTETLLNAATATGQQAARAASGTPYPGKGCVFSGRCPRKLGALCDETTPPFADADADADKHPDSHRIRCHIPAAELSELQRVSAAS